MEKKEVFEVYNIEYGSIKDRASISVEHDGKIEASLSHSDNCRFCDSYDSVTLDEKQLVKFWEVLTGRLQDAGYKLELGDV